MSIRDFFLNHLNDSAATTAAVHSLASHTAQGLGDGFREVARILIDQAKHEQLMLEMNRRRELARKEAGSAL